MKKSVQFTVGRGPVPRHASIETGNGVGWRAVFARVERSRGTGPRATGQGEVLFTMRRSGAGAPELQSPALIIWLIVEIVKEGQSGKPDRLDRRDPAPLLLIMIILAPRAKI